MKLLDLVIAVIKCSKLAHHISQLNYVGHKQVKKTPPMAKEVLNVNKHYSSFHLS